MSSAVRTGMSMPEKQNPARAVPVRVKKKTLKKLSNAERLEMENAKMEERLRTLRKTIEKEKQERSARPDFVWKSGQVGAVTTHAKEHSSRNKHAGINLSEKKIKVKFLTPVSEKGESRERRAVPRVSTPHNSSTTAGTSWAEPQPSPRLQHDSTITRAESQCHSSITRAESQRAETQGLPSAEVQQVEAQRLPRAEGMAWGEVGEMEGIQRQASIVGPVCGQCELNGARLNCMECGEKYCSDCFAIFHKKGALKSHTSRPLTRQANLNSGPPKSVHVEETIAEDSLWGEYDEAAAAQSFLQAVKAWRGEDDTDKNAGNKPSPGLSTTKTTDGSQTSKGVIPEINFSENENVSYFERMLLKKGKAKEKTEDDANSEYSAGEITVSQLDFCRDLLAHNIEEDRKSRMEPERPESVIEIVEVNSNIGYLEEDDTYLIEETVESSDEEETRTQMELGRSLLSNVKIEEYSPRGSADNPSTAGIFSQPSGSVLIEPVENEEPSSRDTSSNLPTRQSVTSQHGTMPTLTTPRAQTPTRAQSPTRAQTPRRSNAGPQDGKSSPTPRESSYTPPRVDRSHQALSVRSSLNRPGRNYTETTRSPLIRRMPTNPEIARQSTTNPVKEGDGELKRPVTADVVILSSQAWKKSFLGFVKAGLPGYTLPSSPSPEEKQNKEEEKEEEEKVMLRGPPSWCPGESHVNNEIFQSRENTISFSLAHSPANNNKENVPTPKTDGKFEKTGGKFEKRGVEAVRKSETLQCEDLNSPSDLEYESEDVLAALGRELSVSKSRDLGDYLTTLRNATPDPVTLLTHQDRMSQLDLESRGITPTATPLITPRITTRESLFLDFEDVEKQIMAGEDVDDIQ
ncbi:hypothetical protein ACHWQZ_G018671 [Mnemiopsis leidyi]